MKAEAVMSTKWESIPQISKVSGMHPSDLWPIVKEWIREGKVEVGQIKTGWCSMPVFRLAPGLIPVWKRKKVQHA